MLEMERVIRERVIVLFEDFRRKDRVQNERIAHMRISRQERVWQKGANLAKLDELVGGEEEG